MKNIDVMIYEMNMKCNSLLENLGDRDIIDFCKYARLVYGINYCKTETEEEVKNTWYVYRKYNILKRYLYISGKN